MTHLLLDVETTGFSPTKNSVVEIGWAWTDDTFEILSEDSIFIFPEAGKEISPDAIEINGYTPELWGEQGAMDLTGAQACLARKLAAAARGQQCLAWAHNASFDKRFCDAFFPCLKDMVTRWQCSMELFKVYCKTMGIPIVGTVKDPETKKVVSYGTTTLAGCAKLAGVPYERAHGALDDCRTLAKVLQFAHREGLLS